MRNENSPCTGIACVSGVFTFCYFKSYNQQLVKNYIELNTLKDDFDPENIVMGQLEQEAYMPGAIIEQESEQPIPQNQQAKQPLISVAKNTHGVFAHTEQCGPMAPGPLQNWNLPKLLRK